MRTEDPFLSTSHPHGSNIDVTFITERQWDCEQSNQHYFPFPLSVSLSCFIRVLNFLFDIISHWKKNVLRSGECWDEREYNYCHKNNTKYSHHNITFFQHLFIFS